MKTRWIIDPVRGNRLLCIPTAGHRVGIKGTLSGTIGAAALNSADQIIPPLGQAPGTWECNSILPGDSVSIFPVTANPTQAQETATANKWTITDVPGLDLIVVAVIDI